MTGPTNGENRLTFGDDPVADTDSHHISSSLSTAAVQGISRELLAFLTQLLSAVHETRRNYWRRQSYVSGAIRRTPGSGSIRKILITFGWGNQSSRVTPLGVGGGLFSQSTLEFLLNCLIFILISWKTEYDVNVVIAPHCLKNMVTLTTSRGSAPNPNLEDTNYWWLTSSSETSSLPEYGFLALTKYSAST